MDVSHTDFFGERSRATVLNKTGGHFKSPVIICYWQILLQNLGMPVCRTYGVQVDFVSWVVHSLLHVSLLWPGQPFAHKCSFHICVATIHQQVAPFAAKTTLPALNPQIASPKQERHGNARHLLHDCL
jgi:hypothetical protein